MKRSEVNEIIRQGMQFLDDMNFKLPPFAHWTPEEWKQKGLDCADIVKQSLGWDITDFGSGDFNACGLFLFTLRNGTQADVAAGSGKVYAEKIMIVREGQVTPRHTHPFKTEDIINRGGGELVIQLWGDNGDQTPTEDGEIHLKKDAVAVTVQAGAAITLKPGESVTLEPGHFHKFWGAAGKGLVLVGEVSRVNDDNTDNCFVPACGRFPAIDEDEAPVRLLIPDYPAYYRGGGRAG